jgi:formate dehydrogenase iron-sulfur subunit
MSYHQIPVKNALSPTPFNWEKAPELKEENQYSYIRHACMHCVEPACESACTVGAITKSENGSVTVNPNRCIGCRYCMMACPFAVPKWEWHKKLPHIRKCTMCDHLQRKGKIPACVDNCPGNEKGPALVFGNRDELLFEAEKRIHDNRDLYLNKVFGRDEIGGTGVLYLMNKNLSPSQVGLPGNLGKRSIPNYAKSPQSTVPYWVGGLGIMLSALNWVIKRRDQVMTEEEAPPKSED